MTVVPAVTSVVRKDDVVGLSGVGLNELRMSVAGADCVEVNSSFDAATCSLRSDVEKLWVQEKFAVGFAGLPGALAEAVDAEPVASWDEAVAVAAGRGEDVEVRHVTSKDTRE